MDTLDEISNIKPRPWHVINNSQYKAHEGMLRLYRDWHNQIDRMIEPHTIVPGDINGTIMASGKLSMLFSTRNMALYSIDEAQKLLTNAYSLASFQFTTTISLLAIAISVVGVAL